MQFVSNVYKPIPTPIKLEVKIDLIDSRPLVTLLLTVQTNIIPAGVRGVNLKMMGNVIVEILVMMDDVVATIDENKITRGDIVLRRHETIVASRRRKRLLLKRLLVTLPATKRVIHLRC